MNRTFNLAEGIDLLGLDLDGLNEFFRTPPARGSGMAVLVSGELTPGNANVTIVQGEPIYQVIVDSARTGVLQLAAVVQMAPYFDRRHSAFLQRALIKEISEARGLKPRDELTTKQMDINEVPYGDIDLMRTVAVRIADLVDDVIGFEIFGDTRKKSDV